MTLQQASKSFKEWYGNLTNWGFPFAIAALIWFGKVYFQGMADDAEQARINTQILLEKEKDHDVVHRNLKREINIQKALFREQNNINKSFVSTLNSINFVLEQEPKNYDGLSIGQFEEN